jgi:hypothetical protein
MSSCLTLGPKYIVQCRGGGEMAGVWAGEGCLVCAGGLCLVLILEENTSCQEWRRQPSVRSGQGCLLAGLEETV